MFAAQCENRSMPAKLPPKAAIPARREFAKRLEAARIAAGYDTMRAFSDALNVSEARYRRWEAAETEPDLMHLQRISRVTGVSLDILISGRRSSEPA